MLNDFVSVSVAYDNTNPSPLPSRWHLSRIAGLAVVLGSIATAGVIAATFMFTEVSHVPIPGGGDAVAEAVGGLVSSPARYLNGTNAFGFQFDPRCFYAAKEAFVAEAAVINGTATAVPASEGRAEIVCNPLCPGEEL